jgi:predicted double-glycine peptidase
LFGAAVAAAVAAPAAPAAECWRAPTRDPDHTFQSYAWSWRELQRQNIVMQSYDYSCGAAALATVLQYYWDDPVTEKQILEVMIHKVLTVDEIKDRIKNGMSLTDLRRVSVEMGYLAAIGTMTFEQLCQSKLPVVVPIKIKKYDHFVVFRGAVCGRVYLADPIRGNVRPTIAEFCGQWQKGAVLAVIKKGEKPRECTRLSIRWSEVRKGETTEEWLDKEIPRPYQRDNP